jgi:glycosyltransferase involved in cell wall biosynthesis
MKILIVSEVFYPEDFIINDLAREWQKMGHEVSVLTQYPSYPQSYVYDDYENKGEVIENWNGIKIYRFPFVEGYRDSVKRKFANYLSFIRGGKKIAKKIGNDFDVLFVSQTGPLTVALPAIAAGKKFKKPVAIWTFDIWPDVVWTYGVPQNMFTRWFLNRLIGYIYKNCDKIFVSSKRFKESIGQYTKKELIYAPNWLRPTEEVKSDLRLDQSKFNFTFTGNISRYQNLINTVSGFGKAQLENSVLNIVGDGSYLEQVKYYVEHHNIKNVVFYGRKPYAQVNDILCQSDVLVLPLMPNEGIMKTEPFKIQSYLHAGKPIFGILGGSGKDIIEENQLGIVSKPDDVDAIAKGFCESVEFAKQYSGDVAIRSLELMNSRFNKDKIVETITSNLPTCK